MAKGYRERHLPADVLVIDWFYYTKMGQMDMVPEKWPDPTAMNRQLHEMGFHSMISIWPRFVPESRYYNCCFVMAGLRNLRMVRLRMAYLTTAPALTSTHQSRSSAMVLEHHS